MKNYDELTNDLLTRRDCYVAAQKQKRITLVTSLCCVCFVALLGFGLWKSGWFNTTPPATGGQSISGSQPQIHTDPAPTTDTEQATIPTKNAPIQILWTVNKVKNTVGAAMKNYNTPEYYSEKKDYAALTEYFGRDFSALGSVMPEGFQHTEGYTPTFFYKNDGTPAYDSCNFLYRKGEAQISIRASRIGVPYDCLYMMENPIPSNINGVELVIGGIYSATNPGHLDLVFADFSHNGIQYRVTVKNVSCDGNKDAPGWMVDILAELIK